MHTPPRSNRLSIPGEQSPSPAKIIKKNYYMEGFTFCAPSSIPHLHKQLSKGLFWFFGSAMSLFRVTGRVWGCGSSCLLSQLLGWFHGQENPAWEAAQGGGME